MNIKTKIGLILALIVFSSGIGVIAYVVLIETGVVTRNRSPTITNLPDQVLEQDTQLLDAFDLDNYTFDPDLDLLSYSIIENTYPQCGISIDNENKIDIIPESGWAGISHITIEVTDGRLKASDTFRVNVYETVSPLPIPLPFDQDFWQELLSYLDPEDVPTLLDTLVNMFDSDVDDLDLGNFSQSILSLLYTGAGELELFRVYNYASIVNMSDTLWKYECFDQYMGDGWKSTSSSDNYDFYPYAEYYSKYFPDLDLLKLKMLISPQIGRNSMVIPSLFPTPFIMENSISAPTLEPESTQLSATEQNCTTVDLNFTSDVDVNMTYELFGLSLPLEEEINQIALSGIYTPSFIKNKYLQLPPTIEVYKNNNPYFKNHWDILNASISDNDNAFQVASKIRNYLQTYFSFPTNPDDYIPAPDGRDIVDWFCETQQGVWSDFASAFCVFTRSFGVVSRFVNGFNSKLVEEFYDSEEGKVGFAIKYKNLYNWAEIYIPTDISGDGKWIQMDMFEEYSGFEGNYNLSVIVDKSIVTRPEIINITATLSSFSEPVNANLIVFTDLTTGENIGQALTNYLGNASIQYSINNSHIVGPHIIEARFDLLTMGLTIISILGDIEVNLTAVYPTEVNRSDIYPDIVNIQGFLFDPINGKKIINGNIDIILFFAGTNTIAAAALFPSTLITNENGIFTGNLEVNPTVPLGQYEVRADFNGTWYIYEFPFYIPMISDSSERRELLITS